MALDTWKNSSDVFNHLFEKEKRMYEMYEEHTRLARKEEDEVSLKLFTEFLDIQINELNEFEVLMSKVKAYSAVPGLFYHLDHELRKA